MRKCSFLAMDARYEVHMYIMNQHRAALNVYTILIRSKVNMTFV